MLYSGQEDLPNSMTEVLGGEGLFEEGSQLIDTPSEAIVFCIPGDEEDTRIGA